MVNFFQSRKLRGFRIPQDDEDRDNLEDKHSQKQTLQLDHSIEEANKPEHVNEDDEDEDTICKV